MTFSIRTWLFGPQKKPYRRSTEILHDLEQLYNIIVNHALVTRERAEAAEAYDLIRVHELGLSPRFGNLRAIL
jgi:hypothetical protein